MIRRAKEVLKDKNGISYISVAVMILAFFMVFSVVLLYSSTVMHIREQQQDAKLTLDNFITENSTDLRGVFSRYLIRGRAVLDTMDASSYLNNLIVTSGLTEQDGMLYRYDRNGKVLYTMTYPRITYVEPQKKTLYLFAEYDISVPLRFNGQILTYATVHTKVRSFFQGKTSNTAAVTTTAPA